MEWYAREARFLMRWDQEGERREDRLQGFRVSVNVA